MICHRCEVDVHPFSELGPSGKFVDRCPKCSTALNKPEALTLESTPASTPKAKASPAPPPPSDVLRVILERLAFVESQIRDVRAFEIERDALRRMIAASEPPPEPHS